MKCPMLYLAVICITWLAVESHLLLHEVLRRSQESDSLSSVMMQYGDTDQDGQLSGEEIEDFFKYFVSLRDSEALLTAQQFIKDGDLNNDARLNETELLNALKKYRYGHGR